MGTRVSVNDDAVMCQSSTQKYITLNMTESETGAAVTCAQGMMYTKNISELLELSVEFPMVLEIDNRGEMDLLNSWAIGGRIRHIGVKLNYLWELNEQGIMVYQ